MSALAERYARGALEALGTDDAAVADALAAEMAQLTAPEHLSGALQQLVHNPAFGAEREAVLGQVLTKMGVSSTCRSLVMLLTQRGRHRILADVAHSLRQLADARAGRLRAHVTSAVPLSAEQVQRIGETLTARMGMPVYPEVAVDPKLIAGMVCRVGELTFDSTLKNQLGLMAERLDTRRH